MNGITSNALKRSALHILTGDGWLLFLTRFARLFAYGALSVVLLLYLAQLGLGESQTGLVLTLTLVGDTVVSLWLTTRADRMGRRHVLGIGAVLMPAAGLTFASAGNLLLLVIAGTIGVISPSGKEVGPFLPIEQAALSRVVPSHSRTAIFCLVHRCRIFCDGSRLTRRRITGSIASNRALGRVGSYRTIMILYPFIGVVLTLFGRLSSATEVDRPAVHSASVGKVLGISHSRRLVPKLSGVFALDSGGFVIQSFAAYWFYLRFGVKPATLGSIFFGANIFARVFRARDAFAGTRPMMDSMNKEIGRRETISCDRRRTPRNGTTYIAFVRRTPAFIGCL